MVCGSQHWDSISTASFIYSLATFIKQSQRASPAQGKGTEELSVSRYHSESFSNHCSVLYGTASQEQNPPTSTCSSLQQGSQIKHL